MLNNKKAVVYNPNKRKQIKQIRWQLDERLKELACVYNLCRIIEKPGTTLEKILQDTANLLPSGWKYHEIACARITFENRIFKTANFKATAWKQLSEITVYGNKAGSVEVYYLKECPKSYEGPFIKEERDLIDAVSERLGRVAERIKVQEALKLTEEKLWNYLESTPDIIMEIMRNGRIEYINYTLPGYDRKTILGKKTIYDFILPEYHKLVRECIEKVYKTKKQSSYEIKGKGTGDDIRYYSTKVAPLIKNNEVSSTMHIARDITERKKAGEALKESEQRFKQLFDKSRDGILVAERETRKYIMCNKAICEMLGYSEDELKHLGIKDIHTEEELSKHVEKFDQLSQEKITKVEDVAVKRKDGSIFYADIAASLVMLGNRKYLMGSFRDITERKKAEEEILALSRFPSENPNPVLRIAKDGEILYTNKPGLELLANWGVKIGEKAPKKWQRLIKEKLKSAKPGSQEEEEEEEVKDKIFLFVIAPAVEAGYVNLYGRNITERKKAEEALKKSKEELREDKIALEQKNLALKELIEHMERTKNKTKEDIAINIDESVMPILKKLRLKGLSPKYVDLLCHHLNELTSSFGRMITQKSPRLSSREIEISNLIKGGLRSKEISELLNISYQTIDKHRRNIRKKLGISKKRANLTSFLQKL